MGAPLLKLHNYNTKTLALKENYQGSFETEFEVVTGSRLVFALTVTSIDPGASVVMVIENGFTVDFPYEQVLDLTASVPGYTKKVLTDIHNFFKVTFTVVGGNATFAAGVSVADNAMTTRIDNAEIHVDLNAQVQSNGQYDSVRIGNQLYELAINPDGSINANIVNTSVEPELIKNYFNRITNLSNNSLTNLIQHITPADKKSYLQRIHVGGQNVAAYEVFVNGVQKDEGRTYFGGQLCKEFNFDGYSENGYEIDPSTAILVKVIHFRPFVSDFHGRIQMLELG